MILTDIEKQSSVWKAIEEHLQERLASLRIKIESDASHEQTMRLRGRIAEVKYILSLAEEEKPIEG